MHIPSERIRNEMYSEPASIWYSLANNGEELAIIIKAPTTAIKALISGCSLNLIFGKIDKYLCIGTQIMDMPDSPIFISGVQRELEDHIALFRTLKERKSPIFLFNEMDTCLAWTNGELMESDANRLIEIIGNKSNLYVGPFTREADFALDSFCNSFEKSSKYPSDLIIDTYKIEVTLEHWQINNLHFIGNQNSQTITIDHENEGDIFERTIWASLDSIFPLTLHKNPQVKTGDKTRELTDILSFYASGSFLIESKDLSVLNAGYQRDQIRRTTGVQKQVKKAIKQLTGASKAFAAGETIIGEKGVELVINRKTTPHCIILITELMHCGDWKEIEVQLIAANKKTGAFFHLVDLREFIGIIKGSSGKAELIDYNLKERFKKFMEVKSIFIRSVPSLKE